MAPREVTLPVVDENGNRDGDIYRGDPWNLKVRVHRDLSAETFHCQLRASRTGPVVAEVDIDPAHLTDELDPDDPTNDPYLMLHLDGDVTAGIEENLLRGDLQGTYTYFQFVVPVSGEFTVVEAP